MVKDPKQFKHLFKMDPKGLVHVALNEDIFSSGEL